MDTLVMALPGGWTIIATIISLLILGLGIYIIVLLIKALRVYIKKNS